MSIAKRLWYTFRPVVVIATCMAYGLFLGWLLTNGMYSGKSGYIDAFFSPVSVPAALWLILMLQLRWKESKEK